jgi:hypothetical protein
MGHRILKESICTSDTVDRLSWFEEVFFYRLIVNCDDYGRMDARPAILKARLFPLKNVTDSQINTALNTLSTAGIVEVYMYDDRPYLQFVTWERHQTIRNHKSKYPSPEDSEIICIQVKSNESKCSRNPIQSNTNPNPNTNALFGEFWEAYPKKKAKPDAIKAFNKLSPDKDLLDILLKAIGEQKKAEEWNKQNGQFIPYPATWLNGRRWEDEVSASTEKKTDDETIKKYANAMRGRK